MLWQDNIICIDTWAYGGGYLTALEVNTMQLHQADNQGGLLISNTHH